MAVYGCGRNEPKCGLREHGKKLKATSTTPLFLFSSFWRAILLLSLWWVTTSPTACPDTRAESRCLVARAAPPASLASCYTPTRQSLNCAAQPVTESVRTPATRHSDPLVRAPFRPVNVVV